MELKNRIILLVSMLLIMALVFMLTMFDFIPEISQPDDPTTQEPGVPTPTPPTPTPIPPTPSEPLPPGETTRWDVTAERTDERHAIGDGGYIYSGEGFLFVFGQHGMDWEARIHGISPEHQGVHLDFPTTVNGYPIRTFSHANGVFQGMNIESVNFARMSYLRSLQNNNFRNNNIREVKFIHNPNLTQIMDHAFSGNPIELVIFDNLPNLNVHQYAFRDLTLTDGDRILRLVNNDESQSVLWTPQRIKDRFPGFNVERISSMSERNIFELWLQPTKKE